jgi:hypothetical protein
MMHPPFDYLSKGPVSNQAMRGSHPHHCAQVAIFDGVINIFADAIPCSGRCFKPTCRRHSIQWGHWWHLTIG